MPPYRDRIAGAAAGLINLVRPVYVLGRRQDGANSRPALVVLGL